MNEQSIAEKDGTMQATRQPSAKHLAQQDHHRYHAAAHLYDSVKPEGGLEWPQLSPDQRLQFVTLIDGAIEQSGQPGPTPIAAELLHALRDSVRLVRQWHGMGMGASEAQAWSIYQGSPEMKRIKVILEKAERRER